MNKRLILVLALAFVVGIAFAAYAEVQNVKVSGDITALGIHRNLDLKGSHEGNDTNENALASITRLRVDADLTDNVMATVRLLNERYWGGEMENAPKDSYTGGTEYTANTTINLDLAYVTLKEFLYSPLTLKIGRQELMFGNQMIVGDPDTNNTTNRASSFNNLDCDLTARKAFDAIRATLNYDPLIVDLVVAKVLEGSLNGAERDDTDLYGINAGYNLGGKYKTALEGYWFEKRSGRRNASDPAKKVARTDVIGGRVAMEPVENLSTGVEAAYQFGKVVDSSAGEHSVARKAWALETYATLGLPKIKYTPVLTLQYEYFSGDHFIPTYETSMGAYRGWDPMYENQKAGDIVNVLFPQTNVHVLGGAVTAKAKDDVTLKGEYFAYWWAKGFPTNYTYTSGTVRTGTSIKFTDKRFVGQEVDLSAMYDYTEDVQFGLLAGFFMPGGSFEKANKNLLSEVIGSMKVTF